MYYKDYNTSNEVQDESREEVFWNGECFRPQILV